MIMLTLAAVPVAAVPLVTWFGSRWLTDHGYNRIGIRPSWVAVPMLADRLVPCAWVAFGVLLYLPWLIVEKRRRPLHARRRAALLTLLYLIGAMVLSGELIGMPWVRSLAHETLMLTWCPQCQ